MVILCSIVKTHENAINMCVHFYHQLYLDRNSEKGHYIYARLGHLVMMGKILLLLYHLYFAVRVKSNWINYLSI